MTPATDGTSYARGPVGYVLTHYPKLAQTFIADEIEAVESAGQPLRIFAMNAPEPGEMRRPGAQAKVARTVYLKPALAAGVSAFARQSLCHPLGMARVLRSAIASGGGHPTRIVRRLAHLAQAALIARHAEREGIERLHAHFGLAPATIAWLATAIARASGRKDACFSFTIHGFHDFVDPAETRLDLKAADATAVFCISDFTRSQLCLTTNPAWWPRFHVVRCGIDLGAFVYRDPPALSARPSVIALGRLSPEKGFAVLIEAVAMLHRRGRDMDLMIIGEGPERGPLEAQIAALGIGDRVRLVGELTPEDVRQELAASDVFAMPSFSEGLPISIMEAMAVGVPVVTTWIAGIPELAREGNTALTVPPADAEPLAQAIERLAQDEPLRLKLARAARTLIEQQHDLDHCGKTVARLLERSPL